MVYCLLQGTLLALIAWILLRLLPRQNASTRFALWFAVLLAIIVVPFLGGTFLRTRSGESSATPGSSGHSLLTLPDSLALAIFGVWAVLAGIGMVRVVIGLWRVNQIRRNSEEMDLSHLAPAVRTSIEDFPRRVRLRISHQVVVPSAIGFFQPAVVIPCWLLDEVSSSELQQILLHELMHLRRRDDWTNLTQKMIKAILFFHPSVWWLEERLSLEREMACDEEVLAQSFNPRLYAQCLARLAEKSLVRRKMAMAQAIVSRMRQLSLRVAQILDADRPRSTRLWKPAVSLVMVAAGLCGFSAWSAPSLVSFQSDADRPTIKSPESSRSTATEVKASAISAVEPKLVLASASFAHTAKSRPLLQRASRNRPHPQPRGDYVVHAEQLILTMPGNGQGFTWKVSMWQVHIVVPSSDPGNKTVSRKTI
jgi:beta-lactamase regulating signal transducer with metallopeptidase domain